MKYIILTLFIVLLIIIPTVTSTTYASDFETNIESIPALNKVPPRVGRWKVAPTVIVCAHAPPTEIQTKSAVRFWEQLGHRFSKTQFKHDPLKKCLSDTPTGYITIHLVSQGVTLRPAALAETHFFVNNETGEIEWAVIYMRDDLRPTVLEHEIGHALGYLHHNQHNHLMHEKLIHGGWDIEGLSR